MTAYEQKLKLALIDKIKEFTSENCEENGWETLGYLPETFEELIADAAFSVILTVKGTNEYIQENVSLKQQKHADS